MPYTYLWALETQPEIGTRVKVPGGDGALADAIIVAFGMGESAQGLQLKKVRRTVTQEEVDKAHAKQQRDLNSWLNMARREAGLTTKGKPRENPPGDYPPIAPATGEASSRTAGNYGNMWWKAYKAAQKANRPQEEIEAFSTIAHRWYAIRDQ